MSTEAVTSMRRAADHAEQQVGTIVFNRTPENLLICRNGGSTFYATESVDGCTDGKVADALHGQGHFIIHGRRFVAGVLDGHTGKADADGSNVASEDVAAIERLSCPNGVVETFKVH